ncbi:MAG: CcmD family protein [Kouleothrix sp.]|jgi:CcmD family protein|nr:CcmD family protein [Kouleothrix sp.]
MPNFLLDPGIAIYAAMAVALVVWLGIFAFLWRLDRLARELRRKLDQQPRAEAAAPRATLEVRAAHPPARLATNDE